MAPDGMTNGTSNGASAVCSLDEFLAGEYDYIVVGGGTSGLCVAARLTENPNVTVGVIEAGADRTDDPLVTTPSLYPQMIGREPYDWRYETVPQKGTKGKTIAQPRGKMLGGSSAINYLMYVRGSRKDYDTWEALGNTGWGWEGLLPYFKKHQHLEMPPKVHANPQFQPIAGAGDYHGDDGPIHTSFNDYYQPFEEDFSQAAYETLGKQSTLHDAYSGDHMGFYSSLAAVRRTTGEGTPNQRSYAATGYLKPNLGRRNLKVLLETLVTKLVLSGGTASGVEIQTSDGKRHAIQTRREVILCGGVINSPQLLELSGIGDPEVLKAAGVECVVENKAIGNNFQDHVLGGITYDLKEGLASLDSLHDANFLQAQTGVYQKTGAGPLGNPGMLMGFVSYASIVSKETLERTIAEVRTNSVARTDFEKRSEEALIGQLSDPTFANLQVFCFAATLHVDHGEDQTKWFAPPPTGKNRVTLALGLEHPFSRGSVHITSSDPTAHPRIDVGYFSNSVDARIFGEGIRWLGKVAEHPVFKKSIAKRTLPPSSVSIESDEELDSFVRGHVGTQYHITGTCALGEAVDSSLRVKGVKNLRVIDASVFPGHVSGNIMATTYAVAEKGSDLVKADDDRFV